eukprot:gene19056-24878_t
MSLILPSGSRPSQLSIGFNGKIFDGWVRQPSPCCAAAVLASAINSLGATNETIISSDNSEFIIPSAEDLFKEMLSTSTNKEDDENENIEDDENIENVIDQPIDIVGSKKKQSLQSAVEASVWNWLEDLLVILKNISGLRKLQSVTPSTTAVGNWGVVQALDKLSELKGLNSSISISLYMGKKTKGTKVEYVVNKSDSSDPDEVKDQQPGYHSTKLEIF